MDQTSSEGPHERKRTPSPPVIPSTGRNILTSLPAPLSSPTCNVNYAQLRASAEALLLLNNACSLPAGSSTEKENINPVVTAPIVPISAPRPLSYAVRGKMAFRSILSVGEDDGVDDINPGMTNDIPGGRSQALQQVYNIPTSVQSILLRHPRAPSFQTKEPQSTQRKATEEDKPGTMIIRPITPSTLMALTEPCLMAWCLKVNEEDLPVIQISANSYGRDAVSIFSDTSASYPLSTDQNSWGY